MSDENDYDSPPPLRPEEIRAIRRIIKTDDRMRWFRATVRIWAGWVSAIIGALWLGWDTVIKFVHAFVRALSGNSG